MAVIFDTPPPAIGAVLDAALPRFAGRASLATHAPSIAAAVTGAPEGRLAVPVHVLGLDAISSGTPPERAPARLWTHLIGDGEHAAIADVDPQSNKLTELSEGPAVQNMGVALRNLQSAPQGITAGGGATAGNQHATVLRVPALYLSAIWLQGDKPGSADDVVIPVASPMSPLPGGKPITMAAFLAALKASADEALRHAHDNSGG
jgi:hypothetical protein